MFIFIRLLLAHFIGDFPLQFDAIFKLKLKGLPGIIPHALIIFTCGIAMCWPYLDNPSVWFFLVFIAAAHLMQDSVKLNVRSVKLGFWAYVADQISHIALIAVVFLTGIKNLQPPADQSNVLIRLYSNDGMMIYLIILISATYNGHFLIRSFKDSFLTKNNECYLYEKWYGMAERAVIVTLFLTPLPLWSILLISLLLRPLTYAVMKRTLALHECFIAGPDMISSWLVGMISGVILYLLQARYPVY